MSLPGMNKSPKSKKSNTKTPVSQYSMDDVGINIIDLNSLSEQEIKKFNQNQIEEINKTNRDTINETNSKFFKFFLATR